MSRSYLEASEMVSVMASNGSSASLCVAGRHAFGTIAGLSQALTKLPKAKRSQFNAHLTLLDIHDGTIARDLCILLLLHELNSTSDSTARSEIKATLTYTFGGVAMPDYCYRR